MKIVTETKQDEELVKDWKQDAYKDIWFTMLKYGVDIKGIKVNKKEDFINEIYNKIKVYKEIKNALPLPPESLTFSTPFTIDDKKTTITYLNKDGLEIAYGPDGRDGIYSKR